MKHKDSNCGEHQPNCGVCATNPFERNNYFYGKQFTVRDLHQEQSYFNDKRYLVNRMVLGWGVVCGLDVSWDPVKRRVVVKPGMALDCCGREIIVCEEKYLSFEPDDEDCCIPKETQKPEGKFVLCMEYHECYSEPVDLPAVGCDDKGKTEYNRIQDTFKLKLKKWDEACPKEPPTHIDCPDHYKHAADGSDSSPNCKTETVHHYLCCKLKKGCPECESCDCVILATIEIEPAPPPEKNPNYQGKQQGNQSTEPTGYKDPVIDSCTNRKLVYNNSLLYDLINCYHGDLPHIVDFNWRTKHAYPKREMGFDVFLEMMRDGLTVYFDQDMFDDSLNEHTFTVSYLYRETGTGTYVRKQIPVQGIKPEKTENCYAVTLTARQDWIKDELDSPNSELLADTRYESGVVIEITLRGSRIWSRDGKGLDGEFLADKLPTGNGSQGGDFFDWFTVIPPDSKRPKGKSYGDQI